MPSNKAPQTIAVSNGIGEDSAFGAVTPPLYLSTNFTFEGFERARQYDYTRSGNPTRDLLANTIAHLEGGAGAIVISTGMAAVDLSLASLEPGTSSSPHMTVMLEHGACRTQDGRSGSSKWHSSTRAIRRCSR